MKGSKTINFQGQNEDFVIKVKGKNYWWLLLLLLLLLPLLLLIPFKKDISFKVIDEINEIPLAEMPVNLKFTENRFIGSNKLNDLNNNTDTLGIVVFKDIRYTLYAYLFHGSEPVIVKTGNTCFFSDSLSISFKDIKSNDVNTIKLPPRMVDVVITVLDKEDNQPLPDTRVEIRKSYLNKINIIINKTDVAGKIYCKAPYCGNITVNAGKNGYTTDSLTSFVPDILNDSTNKNKLYLTAQKGSIKFIVRDLKSKQLLPGATAILKIEGKEIAVAQTNTNGVGIGVFDSVKISAKATIVVQKAFYNDTSKTFTVSEFMNATDEERTLYLRPNLQNVVFRNLDAATGALLPGVKNEITVNGKTRNPEYSNSNGTFLISGVSANDKISITSSLSGYNINNYTIQNSNFGNLINAPQSSRDIPLEKENTPPPPPLPPVDPPNTNDLQGQSGDLRINLQWLGKTDLDLHVIDPCGNEICFTSRTGVCESGTGTLDVDANALIATTTRPQENIYWLTPKPGLYKVVVVCFKFRDKETNTLPFNVTIVDKNVRKDFKGTIVKRQVTKVDVVTHEVK